MSTFTDDGGIDPTRGVIITCVGKKRSGKSIMGLLFFRAYPGDKVVIDVAGDDGPVGEDVVTIEGQGFWKGAPGGRREYDPGDLPMSWPDHLRDGEKPMIVRYVPDPRSETYLMDMDHIVGLAMAHQDCAILVHEIQALAPAGQTPPNMRRLLMHNRHQRITAIFCGPRSQTIDILVLQQSDLIYTFELQGVEDRKRIAENIGWNVREFDAAVLDLGRHEHLVFDANVDKPQYEEEDTRLVHMGAVPPDEVEKIKRWAAGYRTKTKELV